MTDHEKALRELIQAAEAYMRYHAEKFYADVPGEGPVGLWPAIAKAKQALLARYD